MCLSILFLLRSFSYNFWYGQQALLPSKILLKFICNVQIFHCVQQARPFLRYGSDMLKLKSSKDKIISTLVLGQKKIKKIHYSTYIGGGWSRCPNKRITQRIQWTERFSIGQEKTRVTGTVIVVHNIDVLRAPKICSVYNFSQYPYRKKYLLTFGML
jgi:hypothetical protein